MKRIEIAGWVLECDPDETARLLAARPAGAPEACGCLRCRNSAAARDAAYGPEFRHLLATLGVPSDREAEVHDCGPAERWGWRRCGGWFHAVGRVVRDPLLDEAPTGPPFAAFGATFQVYFASEAALVSPAFDGRPLLQVEFEGEVPWVLAEQPDAA